jgi:Ser/Thr protein kinase RdoA (MazF antagonist)
MTADPTLNSVLDRYPADCQPSQVEALAGAGGFSGARFWRLETPRGRLCLRRWPTEHPTEERLQFIQAVLWHVDQEGFKLTPVPLETLGHAGYVRHDGRLWELTPWMPGRADYQTDPSPNRLKSALKALAKFHLAAALFPLPERGPAASPGIRERLDRVRELLGGGLRQLAAAVTAHPQPDLDARAARLLEVFPCAAERVLPLLARAANLRAWWQPCIRDIWHDHVLFQGDEVSGIVDFGALRVDSVATDVARLLGSLAGDDVLGWSVGLTAYETVRPLDAAETALVTAFDESGVLLSGLNWLTWIYQERREFDDRRKIAARIDANLARLTHLVACGNTQRAALGEP